MAGEDPNHTQALHLFRTTARGNRKIAKELGVPADQVKAWREAWHSAGKPGASRARARETPEQYIERTKRESEEAADPHLKEARAMLRGDRGAVYELRLARLLEELANATGATAREKLQGRIDAVLRQSTEATPEETNPLHEMSDQELMVALCATISQVPAHVWHPLAAELIQHIGPRWFEQQLRKKATMNVTTEAT